MNVGIYLALLLFSFTAFRFYRRYLSERKRQEMVTWPTAPARLKLEDISLERSEQGGARYTARIEGGYSLYAQGKKYTGQNLLPEAIVIDEDERHDIEQWLDRRTEFPVRFNPKAPEENTLLIGHNGLTWGRIYVYLFFGVVLPIFLLYLFLPPII